jgi:hypothetical protein
MSAIADKTDNLLTKYTVSNVSHLWGQQQKDIDQLFCQAAGLCYQLFAIADNCQTLLTIVYHCLPLLRNDQRDANC